MITTQTNQMGDDLTSKLESFIESINAFDYENSVCRYDKAILLDALRVVKRIESIREMKKEVEN